MSGGGQLKLKRLPAAARAAGAAHLGARLKVEKRRPRERTLESGDQNRAHLRVLPNGGDGGGDDGGDGGGGGRLMAQIGAARLSACARARALQPWRGR